MYAPRVDRIAPTRRPEGKNTGTQLWRELLFLHWKVPVEALRPLVPARLSLDLWEGEAYVGVVPFLMREIAPSWWPKALGFDFLECNLRTYVHLEGEGPGVYFFSLEASSWLAVQAARVGWGLPYHHARMSTSTVEDVVAYETVRRGDGAKHAVKYRVGEALGPSVAGSLEHFLLERYLLYSEKGGQLVKGQVHHPPYPAQRATVLEVEDSLIAAAGSPAVEGPPALVHYAAGVDVEVFSPYSV